MRRLQRRDILIGAAALVAAGRIGTRPAAAKGEKAAKTFVFRTHAAFFSEATRQPRPLDPQVFVQDFTAKAGTGPQGIPHATGFRPALLGDPPDTLLFNAEGALLSPATGQWIGAITLAQWMAAKGNGTLRSSGRRGAQLAFHFTGLRPGGVYSLFIGPADRLPAGAAPLGEGDGNRFQVGADGAAKPLVPVAHAPSLAEAVMLVFHSDGQSHGQSLGRIGVTSHVQLVGTLR